MAFYATQPSTRTYVDTSQPLSGFGDDGLLAIYDGVAGLGASPSSCGCSGRRGRLAGLGDEILPPDDGLPVAASVNYMTAVTALLAAGTVVALGYFLLSPKAMRANGRKRKRRVALRRNAANDTVVRRDAALRVVAVLVAAGFDRVTVEHGAADGHGWAKVDARRGRRRFEWADDAANGCVLLDFGDRRPRRVARAEALGWVRERIAGANGAGTAIVPGDWDVG